MKSNVTVFLSLIIFFVVTSLLLCEEVKNDIEGDKEIENEKNIGDAICGPKCVSFLLGYYGKEQEDIIRLVREIQYPEIREGATLSKIIESLEKRGIYTCTIKVKPSARLVWKFPVIVHLKPRSNEQIGHYVVWLPESCNNDLRIWNGDEGMQNYQERTWSKERAGVVLLTSPEPIIKPGKAVKWVGLPFYDVVSLAFAWFVFLSGVGLVIKAFWQSKRSKNFSLRS
jgi:ABC-type bacteriocin/lantibiotic exporter with double-glycine peptidase domain